MMNRLFLGYWCLILSFIASAQEVTTINLWEQDPPSIAGEIDKWIAVFQNRFPKIRIVRQHYENEELRRKFLRSAMTGDGADIVYGPNDIAGVFASARVIQPVDDLIRQKAYSPRVLEMTRIQNRIWGVPLSEGAHLLLYFRKSRVKSAPKTTEEMFKQAKDFNEPKQGRYGLAFYQTEPFWFVPFLGAFGGWPLARKGELFEVTIDTPATRKALQYLINLRDKAKMLPGDCDFDCAKSLFITDRALFHISGDWELNGLRDKLGNDLGIAPLPQVSETGKTMTPMMGGRFIYISSQVKGKKLAAVKNFIDFLGSDIIQRRIAHQLASIPASVAVRGEAEIQALPLLKESIAAAAQSKPMPPQVEMRAAWDGMRIMIQRAMSGTESVDEAVKSGQKAADEALRSLRASETQAAEKK